MRAALPDAEGFAESHGAKVGYEVFGEGGPTLLLLPTWNIVHSRFWKLQGGISTRERGELDADRELDVGAGG